MCTWSGIIVIVLISIAQANCETKAELRDVWDNANQYLLDFVAAVQDAIDASLKELDGLLQSVAIAADEASQNSKTVVEEFSDYFDSVMTDIKSRNENTTSVDFCMVVYGWTIYYMVGTAEESITTCNSEYTDISITEISEASAEINDKLNIAEELMGDIDACTIADDSDMCIASVAINILLQTIDVPSTIKETAVRTTAVVEAYRDELPKCSEDRLANAYDSARLLDANLQVCITANDING